ncbi:MAG: sigma-70 family RNA polymerase sigma factor [Acidimicrobiia bacterium]|nr:sigma-70 family RNA polymerase sigma factor [Acidimicrobiia bacterium]
MAISGRPAPQGTIEPRRSSKWGMRCAPIDSGPAPDVLMRARAGDHGAFGELVGRYDERLRRLAFRLLGCPRRMDDALQEAYVKAYRGLSSFEGRSSVGTWLYRITYNTCLDLLRSESRRETTTLEVLREQPDTAPGPDGRAAERADLAAALAALPPDQRAAVLLVDAEGYDYDAAGDILGVARGTVASRLSRARSALRAALAEDEGGPT